MEPKEMQILGIPFQRDHNSEILSVQQKIKINSRNAVLNYSVEEKTNSKQNAAAEYFNNSVRKDDF
jgi:hypothetical protein